MKKRMVRVADPRGIHARAAATLVALAESFTSSCYIKTSTSISSLSNITGILSLDVSYGDEITVLVDGLDEDEAMERISDHLSHEMI